MNSQMIVRTCCKLTQLLALDDCPQPDSFAVLNVVPVHVSIVMTNVLML